MLQINKVKHPSFYLFLVGCEVRLVGDDRAVKVPAACRHSVTDAKRHTAEMQNNKKHTKSGQKKALKKKTTPRKTNMSPENQWLEDVFPIEIVPF